MGVIAPASAVAQRSDLDRGVHALRQLGVDVVLGRAVGEVRGYLGGEDARRADDLFWALTDPEIDAVWCARGGYGSQRTIAALGPERLGQLRAVEPRALVGFSDVTVLHAFITEVLGWVSFYGPGVSKLGRANEYTLAGVRAALFDAQPFSVVADPSDGWITTLVSGSGQGRLAGGVLPRLASLTGTPLQVNFADRICFLEDVNATVMGVDAQLTQLIAAGCFDGCRAIAIGDHIDVTPRGQSLALEQVFADLLQPLGLPCCYYLPIGHGPNQATLPIGAQARFDADLGTLEIIESPVS